VALGCVFLGYIALRFCQGYLDDVKALADLNTAAAIAKLGFLFRFAILMLAASLSGFALLLLVLARRIMAENRFPPSGMKVIMDTRVVTGEAARVRARVVLVVAGTLMALAFCFMLWGWRVMATLAPAVAALLAC
jgi:hypothetical protein